MDLDKVLPALIQRVATLEAARTTSHATLEAAQTTANIAFIAAIMSFVGVVITGVIARRNGFVQARTTQQLKHAEFRQKWIDDLRAEMARFTLLTSSPDALTKKRPEVMQSMALIMMRMDREDEDHDRLQALMHELIKVSGDDDTSDAAAKAFGEASARFLQMSQAILKREWEVLKHDMHATPWGWPISALVRGRSRRDRAERVEINRRRRENLPLTPDKTLFKIGQLRVQWKARQKSKAAATDPWTFGRLILRRKALATTDAGKQA